MRFSLATEFGWLSVRLSARGLQRLSWNSGPEQSCEAEDSSFGEAAEKQALAREVQRQISEFFSGSRRSFDLALDMEGTDFQMRVWRKAQSIPFGERVSYSDLAESLGCPGALRALGTALGKNPLLLVIPCHRVIAKSGKLGGYAGGGSLKEQLLLWESGRAKP